MKRITTSIDQLDIHRKIEDLFIQTERYQQLCLSPKRTEFAFCALLAAWETTTLQESTASRWRDVWQDHCRKRHHGSVGKTLTDSVKARPGVTEEERTKAYATVAAGLRRVFKATLKHYALGEAEEQSLVNGSDPQSVLFQTITTSFKTAKSLADPAGFEVYLLTLIELFEQSFGTDEASLYSRKSWLGEIRRRRLGGSPESRTLADVAPVAVRIERQNAMSEKERIETLQTMLSTMRYILADLTTYLEKHLPEKR